MRLGSEPFPPHGLLALMFRLPDSEASSRTQPVVEDMHFQKQSWIAERVAWMVMFVILVATAVLLPD